MDIGELRVDVAFLGVPACDEFGNADGTTGAARCGSLGFAMVDAARARCVVLVTEDLVSFPHALASIRQDQVDLVVTVNSVGDPKKIAVGAVPTTANPRELLIARYVADVLINSGLFVDGFSMRTGSDASAVATTRYLREEMVARGVRARWALGGIAGDLVEMSHEGLVSTLLDVRSLDAAAVDDLAGNSNHREISANEYANPFSKGAAVDELDMVVLPALEVGLDFGVNVLTGSNGVMSGTSGGHCDAAAGAKLAVVVAPLLRGRVPTVVEQVTTLVTPGSCVGALVTDYGVAVNPARPELADRLSAAGLPVRPIEELYDLCTTLVGKPGSEEFTDKVVGIVRYRDGSVIDTVHEVAR
jgi:citrate lyase subunit alpha/citrate CoA-transferase